MLQMMKDKYIEEVKKNLDLEFKLASVGSQEQELKDAYAHITVLEKSNKSLERKLAKFEEVPAETVATPTAKKEEVKEARPARAAKEEVEEVADNGDVDLESMRKADLEKIAKGLGIKGAVDKRKSVLIEEIQAAQSAEVLEDADTEEVEEVKETKAPRKAEKTAAAELPSKPARPSRPARGAKK